MAKRAELIFELIETYEYDPRTLLDSLIRALPEDVALDHLEYVLRVGDYSMKLDDEGNLVPRYDEGGDDE